MSRKRKPDADSVAQDVRAKRLATLSGPASVAGIPGPGRWLVVDYQPTALFSLKLSLATSSVGKTLVVPTPYSIKMALVDAVFRTDLSESECSAFLRSLVGVDVRIKPPDAAVVTHTFVKVRQEAKAPNKKKQSEMQYRDTLIQKLSGLYSGFPVMTWDGLDVDKLKRAIDSAYDSSIAYREVAHHHGNWQWAFDLAGGDEMLATRLVDIAAHVNYIGKRGSFIQFVGLSRRTDLGPEFTQPVQNQEAWQPPPRAHILPLDDFGPEADMETLSSFTFKRPVRDKHRRFVRTIIPLGLVNTGPGFSEYRTE